MKIISPNIQNRWKDCFAPSPNVKLTLRTNGEEQTQIVTPNLGMVVAGLEAPTVAATLAAGPGGGSMTVGAFVGYLYVYASSHYPFVDNIVTGGGQLWPRSNSSPASAVFTVTSSGSVAVTVTKTTRSDVDNIWIYRTAQFTTSQQATNALAAGTLFYVGSIGNNGIAGTVVYNDSSATDTGEVLELDNFVAPTAQFCVYDGTYWWTFGNFELDVQVTLNGSSTFVLSDSVVTKWFQGRKGQTCKFDGVTVGGFDNQGSFYFQPNDNTTAYVSQDPQGNSTLSVLASGTTTIRIIGPQSTLYRSKPRNPFSWGFTDVIQSTDDLGNTVDTLDPQEWALAVGGGSGEALAVISSDRRLKVDLESPSRCYSFDLEAASGSPTDLGLTKRTVDERYSCGSHFTQYAASSQSGHTLLMGIDSKNYAILEGDGELQTTISTKIQTHLKTTFRSNGEERFWHGGYDPRTEMNVWWVKRVDLTATGTTNKCDTLLWNQPATNTWGVQPDFGISASATVYDPVTDQSFLMIGTENGFLGRAFEPSTFTNLIVANEYKSGPIVFAGGNTIQFFTQYNIQNTSVSPDPFGQIALVNGQNATIKVGDFIIFNLRDNPSVLYTGNVQRVQPQGGFDTVIFIDNINIPTNSDGGTLSLNFRTSPLGEWFYVTDSKGNNEVWARCNSFLLGIATFDAIVPRGTQQMLTNFPAIDTTYLWYLGLIPCYARRYFDLQNETKQKSNQEVWATMKNLDTSTNAQYLRFYREYSTTLYTQTDSFKVLSITQGNNQPSDNWVTKTAVPSSIVYQFGMEYAEFGFLAWTLMNTTLSIQPLK